MRSSLWGMNVGTRTIVFAVLLILVATATVAQTVADQLANCKSEGADLNARIQACTRTLEGAVDNEELRVEALLQRGVLYELWGDQEAAIADYSEIITLDASSAIAHFNRGNVRDRLGQQDLAIQDYSEAIRLDPTDPDMFNNRGQVYDSHGEFDLAIADYSEAIRLDATSSRPYYNRGLSYFSKGEFKSARADFDQAISLQPNDADALVARAATHEELGDQAAALTDYRRALGIAPEHAEAKEASSGSANEPATPRQQPENVTGIGSTHARLTANLVFTLRICRSLKPPGSCKNGFVLLLRPRIRALAVLLAVVHVGAALAGPLLLAFLPFFFLPFSSSWPSWPSSSS